MLSFASQTCYMKKILSIIILFFATQITYAQADSVNFFPSKGYWGVGLNVNGLINNTSLGAYQDNFGNDLIFGRYFFKEKSVLRMGLGVDFKQYSQTVTDSLGAALRNFDSSYSRPAFYAEFGIEHHLFTAKRLDPYFGASLGLGVIGQSRTKTKLTLEDTTGVSELSTDLKTSGGFRIGVNALVGFNYFVARNFAIGAEYTLGYAYQQDGGDFDKVVISTPVTGQSSSRRELGSDLRRQNSILVSGQLDIRLSYYFPTRNKGS